MVTSSIQSVYSELIYTKLVLVTEKHHALYRPIRQHLRMLPLGLSVSVTTHEIPNWNLNRVYETICEN